MYRTTLAALFASFLGLTFILWITPNGAGITPDSVDYLVAARNFAAGNGLTLRSFDGTLRALSHYPPLFPTLLSPIFYFDISTFGGLRTLLAIFFGINLALTAFFVSSVTKKETLGVAAGFFFLVAPVMILIHTMVWSEPVFLFFELLFLLAIISANKYQDYELPHLLAGIFSGLAILTRFAGVSLVLTGLILLLFQRGSELKAKFYSCTVFFTGAILPLIPIFAKRLFSSEDVIDRTISYHPIALSRIPDTLFSLIGTLLPIHQETISLWSALIVAFLLVGLWHARELRLKPQLYRDSPKGIVAIPLTFIISYCLTIFASSSFIDAGIPFNTRIFSPLYPAILALFLVFLDSLGRHGGKLFKSCLVLIALFVVIFSITTSIDQTRLLRAQGVGFASRALRESPEFKLIEKMDPARTLVISNAPEVIWLYTNIPAQGIPALSNPELGKDNSHYKEDLEGLKSLIQKRTQDTYIVFFRSVNWRSYLPVEEELRVVLGLEPFQIGEQIAIYVRK